jgi:hypothetical protein
MEYQRKRSAGKINTAEENRVKQFLQNIQRVLQPVAIRNPFAEQLVLPGHIFKPRRTNAQYLAFIEAVTFYHQYQRTERMDEDTGEVYIETSLEDIAAANQLMKEVLLRKSDDLPGACRNYLEQVTAYLQEAGAATFTNLSISKALRIPLSSVKRNTLALLQAGYLHKLEEKGTRHFTYTIASSGDYKAMQTSIFDILDNTLQAIKASQQPNGSVPVQSANKPVKALKISTATSTVFTQ